MKKPKWVFRRFVAVLAALLCVLTACGASTESTTESSTESASESAAQGEASAGEVAIPLDKTLVQPGPQKIPAEQATALLATLSTEQKVGQLFVVNVGDGAQISNKTRSFLQETNAGNVILFGNNSTDADEIASLNRQLQEEIIANTGVAAFIGIDQEGGDITRIRTGATWFPGAMAMSASGADLELAGRTMGEELRMLGINVNFAPDSDINSNPYNPVINTRSYGDTPERVAQCAVDMLHGLQQGGVVACVKHFPGHGDTSTDSHYGLPLIDKSRAELDAMELVPFRAAIEGGVDMVMSAHIMFPQVDAQYPATMSKAVLTGILREDLGFQGLIITDSLRMGAIADNFGVSRACVQAVQAGADLLLTGSGGGDLPTQQAAYKAVLAAVQSGDISVERLDESVLRILTVKARCGILDAPYPSDALAGRDWSEHEAFAEQAALDSITLTRDEQGLLPLAQEESVLFLSVMGPVLLTEDASGAPGKRENSVARLLAEAFGGADWLAFSAHVDNDNGQIAAQAARYDKVVLAVRSAAASTEQTRLIRSVAAANQNLILVSMGSPYDGAVFRQQAGTFLCAYEYTPPAVRAVVRVLTQGKTPQGTMPVT